MALSDVFFSVASGVGTAAPQILSAATGTTSGGVYMAKLGEFMFSLDTAAFQELQRTTEYRWASLNRIGREPAAQFLGRGDDTIELSGAIYPHFRGGLGQIGLLRQMAETGEPQDLVYAFESVGQYVGRWSIKSIKEGRTVFFDDGTPRKIDFSISIVAYGEDSDMGGMSPTISIFDTAIQTLFGAAGITPPSMLATGGFVDAMADAASTIAALPTVDVASAASDVAAEIAAAVVTVAENSAAVAERVIQDTASIVAGEVAPAVLAALPQGAVETARVVVGTAEQIVRGSESVSKAASVLSEQPTAIKEMAKDYHNELLSQQRELRTANSDATRIADAVAKTGGIDNVLAAGAMRNVARGAAALDFTVTECAAQVLAIGGKISG